MALGRGLARGLARGWFPAGVVGRDVLWARIFCVWGGVLRIGEHFVHRVTDCAEGNQSRLLSAQNVPLCTKFSVTCDRPWPAGGDGAGRGAGWVLRGCLGYLWATWAAHAGNRGRHGLRRLRAQAIRAAHAGTGDGVTGAGGVVGDDRRTRRHKDGDLLFVVLMLVGHNPRTPHQVGVSTQPCPLSYGFSPGPRVRWVQ